MSTTKNERQDQERREDAATAHVASEDAGVIEAQGLQSGAGAERPAPEEQPQDPPEELEEERRG